MKSLYGEGLLPAVPVVPSSCGASGSDVSLYAGRATASDRPQGAGAVELGVVADLERVALRRGRFELPERPRGAGNGEVDHLDEIAAVDPRL